MICPRFARFRGEPPDSGAVLVFVAIVVPVLLGIAAFAVDISRWYVEMQRLQKTVDAAALAAAPWMPDSLGSGSKAVQAAQDTVTANGYSGASAVVTQGRRPTEVGVRLSKQVENSFARILGVPTTRITRSALAEFVGPAPLGSPCNVHGNEPNEGTSALPTPLPANCSSFPQFWSTIVGPEVYKTQGDQFSPRKCGVVPYQESECVTPGVGGPNREFDSRGYVLTIRVREPVSDLKIEVYDPAYIDTGSRCEDLPAWSGTGYPDDPGHSGITNARERYRSDATPISPGSTPPRPSYCAGDNDNRGGGNPNLSFQSSEIPTTTSYGVLRPTDTLNPFDAAANENNRIGVCSKQFPGFSKTGTGTARWAVDTAAPASFATGVDVQDQLSRTGGESTTRLMSWFHQWVELCTIQGSVPPGDYYLRIRTDQPYANEDSAAVFSATAGTSLGNGSNRISVRAIPSTGSAGSVSVSPYQRMSIFANTTGSSTDFNLIRVVPEAAGANIIFTFFDVGDAGAQGTLTVKPPTEARRGGEGPWPAPGSAAFTRATDCSRKGTRFGTQVVDLPDTTRDGTDNCFVDGILNTNGYNGQKFTIVIPVPADYKCDSTDAFGCWWRLNVNFPGATVTDQTTWTAVLDSDPVRLTQ